MKDLEKQLAAEGIINLCAAGNFVLGHSRKLIAIEGERELLALFGVVDGIEALAKSLLTEVKP